MSTAVVVGGGIGGLATALALTERGWDVEVLERAPAFAEVGAGLSIWPNAVTALKELGLADQIVADALPQGQAGIRESSGRWIMRTDDEEVRDRFGDVLMLHRADLLDRLRSALPEDILHAGVTVGHVDEDGAVQHSQGTSRADVVVGADGINSQVRASLWGDIAPRYAGYTAWRFVTDPIPEIRDSSETWGRGERFGYAPLPDGRIYCFAVANADEGGAEVSLADLRHRFAGWHEPIPELLATVDEAVVLRHDIYDLPDLATFTKGRVALVGDAAHAMTPNLGQGACQALEDAVVLARALDDPAHGLAAYDHARRPRTQMIVANSRRIGQMGQVESPVLAALRNLVLRLTPASASNKSLTRVLDWTP